MNPALGRKRLVLIASILGSGAVFLESTVVTVALPAIGRDFALGIEGLQWVVNAYLLTLGSLILLGGALGDRYLREKVFRIGAIGFAATSALCAIAPNVVLLSGLRFVQGISGALLVPNSLALIEQTFSGEERGGAIGKWAAGSAAWTAVGPLVGGAVVSAISWRWVFALVVPFGLAAALVLPGELSQRRARAPRVDYVGALLVTAGLGALVGALIAGPDAGFSHPLVVAGIGGGVVLLAAFVAVQWRTRDPLVALDVFRSRQFTGANIATFLIYGALGAVLFLLMLVLQNVADYTALEAGSALLPVNALLVLGSSHAGRLAGRVGPRLPMSAGALIAGAGLALLTRIESGGGESYVTHVLPGIIVFGIGLTSLVAPLTAAVLESLGKARAGLASGVNNAVARLAGLIATAAIPLAAGIGGLQQISGSPLVEGFRRAMWICAALCALGSVVSWLTVRGASGGRRGEA